MTALPLGLHAAGVGSRKVRGAGHAPGGRPRGLRSPRTLGPSRGRLCPRSAPVHPVCSYQKPGPLGPSASLRGLRCLRKGCRPHWNAEAARRRQGREGVGLAAPRDDAREWGESGQLPEGEQASWALELRAGPQCQLRERKARGNTSIESLLPGAQCLSTWSCL